MTNKKCIYVIQGPNLNLLGQRNPDVYGHATLDDIHQSMIKHAEPLGVTLMFYQSNHEGALIDKIQQGIQNSAGLIINPAAYTHTSIALADTLEVYPHPFVEVHLSNISQREAFRRHSYVSPLANTVIMGKGANGYLEALDYLAQQL